MFDRDCFCECDCENLVPEGTLLPNWEQDENYLDSSGPLASNADPLVAN